jgi:O-antigen ligase
MFLSTFLLKPDIYKRVIFETIDQITSKNEISSITLFSPGYTQHYLTAIEIFKDNTIFGGGPKTFRKLCDNYPYEGCSTHPHNFLMQLLSETGLIGTLVGIFIYLSFVSTLIKMRPLNKNDESKEHFLIFITSFIAIYFPFLPSNNFFHQWVNVQNYILIGFIMYTYLNIKKTL